MKEAKKIEKRLLQLQEEFRALPSSHVRAEYRALHKRWMQLKKGKPNEGDV